MKTRSLRRSLPSDSSSTASQLGSQLWLIQRAVLPPWLASITYSSLSVNRKVWPLSASPVSPLSTSSWVRRCPLYSIRRSPFLMAAAANTPLPWICERRATILRGMRESGRRKGEAGLSPFIGEAAIGMAGLRCRSRIPGFHSRREEHRMRASLLLLPALALSLAACKQPAATDTKASTDAPASSATAASATTAAAHGMSDAELIAQG